jgi:hypothetical protein
MAAWSCAEEFEAKNGKPAESQSARREAIAGHVFGGDSMMSGRCEQRDLADGSRLLVFAPEADHDGFTQGAQLVRKDGTRIAVFQTTAIADYGSGLGKTFTVVRDDLPLSVDQLVTIATSRPWRDQVSDSVLAAGETLESFHLLDNGIADCSAR